MADEIWKSHVQNRYGFAAPAWTTQDAYNEWLAQMRSMPELLEVYNRCKGATNALNTEEALRGQAFGL